jgi:hypothetical protein
LKRQKTIGKDNIEVWLVPLVSAEEEGKESLKISKASSRCCQVLNLRLYLRITQYSFLHAGDKGSIAKDSKTQN